LQTLVSSANSEDHGRRQLHSDLLEVNFRPLFSINFSVVHLLLYTHETSNILVIFVNI